MRFYLISDNIDAKVGMRLAGVDGVVVSKQAEVEKALSDVMAADDVAVLLMTHSLTAMCPDLIDELKQTRKQPLIVEIPDRNGYGRARDSITRYVREAIGIKL